MNESDVFKAVNKVLKHHKILDGVLRADLVAAIAAQPVSEQGDPVGVAVPMPGTKGGFTMCSFKASDVPEGTKIYTAPPPTTAH